MSRNTMFAIVALLVLGAIGAGGALWAYKKYRSKQRQEYRYEGKMGTAREGFDVDRFRAELLAEDVLDRVVEEHGLVGFWNVDDAATAKERLRKKFQIKVVAMEVRVSYQDKSKEMAQKILRSIVDAYYSKAKEGGGPGF